MRIERFYGHSVLIDHLDASSTVLDLGSHSGGFAQAMASRFRCDTFCVEPNPALYQVLAANPAVSAFNLAVTSRPGSACFYVTENSECSSLIPPKISKTVAEIECQGVTLEALLETIGSKQIDVLKMDIEGQELELLASLGDAALDHINQLSVEFHESIGIGTTKDVLRTINHLKHFGFEAIKGSFFDYCDVLFLHPVRLRLPSCWRWLASTERVRNGIARRLLKISSHFAGSPDSENSC